MTWQRWAQCEWVKDAWRLCWVQGGLHAAGIFCAESWWLCNDQAGAFALCCRCCRCSQLLLVWPPGTAPEATVSPDAASWAAQSKLVHYTSIIMWLSAVTNSSTSQVVHTRRHYCDARTLAHSMQHSSWPQITLLRFRTETAQKHHHNHIDTSLLYDQFESSQNL